ncbi:MAG: hypothetical protein AAFR20_11450, partial [Pseudomonadota bacterium]
SSSPVSIRTRKVSSSDDPSARVMGVLPLQFKDGQTWKGLNLQGDESVTIHGMDAIEPRGDVKATITRADGSSEELTFLVRIDTGDELDYFRNGGILHYVIRKLAA